MLGEERFLFPKIPSYKITDVATAIAPNAEQKIVGVRPGEKIHEEMITESDSFTTADMGDYYAILPQRPQWKLEDFLKHFNAKMVDNSFRYSSGKNTEWLTVEDIRELIVEHVDSSFSVTDSKTATIK